MNMTELVVAFPTPAAPPLVLNPMWAEMRGIANPKAVALEREYNKSQLCQKSRAP
jgi:hypothetical protein